MTALRFNIVFPVYKENSSFSQKTLEVQKNIKKMQVPSILPVENSPVKGCIFG